MEGSKIEDCGVVWSPPPYPRFINFPKSEFRISHRNQSGVNIVILSHFPINPTFILLVLYWLSCIQREFLVLEFHYSGFLFVGTKLRTLLSLNFIGKTQLGFEILG